MTSPPLSPRAEEPARSPSGSGLRLAALAILVALGLLVLNGALLFAALERGDAVGIFAVEAVITLSLLGAALLHIRQLTKERRRYALGTVLGDLSSAPSDIESTARQALTVLIAHRVADAGAVALAGDDSEEMRPVAAHGYPGGWIAGAPPRALPARGADVETGQDQHAHPWVSPIADGLGDHPWVARIPLLSGGNPIGLLLLAGRQRGPLNDHTLLARFGAQLATALDHAAMYEASYDREQGLEALDRRRRDFIAALAHELRTPLTSIQAFSDLLQLQPMAMDETAEQLVDSLNQGVQRLNFLVDDLLDLGQSESTGFTVTPTLVDLPALFGSAETLLRPAYLLRQQSLSIEIGEGGHAVLADRQRLEQVLLGLLSNANRYTPPGGTVAARSVAAEGNVRIEVDDSGEGVPEGLRKRIFDPYYRVDRDDATVHGSGLGLAVARQLIELQSGRIWVEQSPAGGARFCVELPQPAAGPTTAVVEPTAPDGA